MFSLKDFVLDSLKSRVVYQFTCASCGARYIGEPKRHFKTRVNEHLFRDKNSHIRLFSPRKNIIYSCSAKLKVKSMQIYFTVL